MGADGCSNAAHERSPTLIQLVADGDEIAFGSDAMATARLRDWRRRLGPDAPDDNPGVTQIRCPTGLLRSTAPRQRLSIRSLLMHADGSGQYALRTMRVSAGPRAGAWLAESAADTIPPPEPGIRWRSAGGHGRQRSDYDVTWFASVDQPSGEP